MQMRRWKKWEAETASLEYQFANGESLPLCISLSEPDDFIRSEQTD
jgi:hypothetical protein